MPGCAALLAAYICGAGGKAADAAAVFLCLRHSLQRGKVRNERSKKLHTWTLLMWLVFLLLPGLPRAPSLPTLASLSSFCISVSLVTFFHHPLIVPTLWCMERTTTCSSGQNSSSSSQTSCLSSCLRFFLAGAHLVIILT